jgi:hypothetical protein
MDHACRGHNTGVVRQLTFNNERSTGPRGCADRLQQWAGVHCVHYRRPSPALGTHQRSRTRAAEKRDAPAQCALVALDEPNANDGALSEVVGDLADAFGADGLGMDGLGVRNLRARRWSAQGSIGQSAQASGRHEAMSVRNQAGTTVQRTSLVWCSSTMVVGQQAVVSRLVRICMALPQTSARLLVVSGRWQRALDNACQ